MSIDSSIDESLDYLEINRIRNQSLNKSYFIETHGCQMNVADSELVETILDSAGY